MIVTVFNGATSDANATNPSFQTTGGLDFDIVSGGAALKAAAADTSARATVLMTATGSFQQAFQADSELPITLTADNTVGVFVDHGDGTWTWTYTAPKGTAPVTNPINVTAHSTGRDDGVDAFNYTVLQTPDTQAPVVTAPATPPATEATGPGGAVVSFGPAAVRSAAVSRAAGEG